MVGEVEATETVDAAQQDLEMRLARLWSAIELLDRYSWRVLEGVEVDDDARAALTAAYTSATSTAVAHDLADTLASVVRSTLVVVAGLEDDVSWAAKRWVEYATTALVCRTVLPEPEPAPEVEAAVADDDAGDEAGPVLVGGTFGWAEYEVLTYAWRTVVGPLHPDDPPLTEDPDDEEDDEAPPTSATDDAGHVPTTEGPRRKALGALWQLVRGGPRRGRRVEHHPADDTPRHDPRPDAADPTPVRHG